MRLRRNFICPKGEYKGQRDNAEIINVPKMNNRGQREKKENVNTSIMKLKLETKVKEQKFYISEKRHDTIKKQIELININNDLKELSDNIITIYSLLLTISTSILQSREHMD